MANIGKTVKLGVFTLAIMNVTAVVSLRGLPAEAEYGLSSAFYYLFAAIVFLIPTALVAAELAAMFQDKQGGVFRWVGEAFGKKGNDVFRKLETFPIPVIAAVNGYALGGGNEIAMACDIRIASTKAIFGQPEVNLGIMPCFGGTQRLTRLVGAGIAKELMFTARNVTAEEAYRIGLANKVVPQAELLDTCKAMAEKIMSKGSYAISLAKEAINTGTETDLSSGLTLEADLFGLAFSTDDKKEGMTAFLEKRKANLTDF